ncbi:MAG: DUF423 domain-containing protein [Candidatus Symbiobacter sp.]|nr:DUF423 domain-containing protein [Candidatus Symbiobacter sp.]
MADGSLSRFLTKGSNHRVWLRLGLFLAGVNGAMGLMGWALSYHGAAINPHWGLAEIDLASRMQFFHALAFLALAILAREFRCACVGLIMILFLIGIMCFCGGLYGIGFFQAEWGTKITPYGGAAFIFGWLWLVALSFKKFRN